MPTVHAIIETKNTSGVVTKQEITPIISSVVKREGRRAVDTAEITVSGDFNIEQNYYVKYIQDIAEVTNLKGIWNFQNSGRDEAGWDIWENTNSVPAYIKETAEGDDGGSPPIQYGKFRNRYVLSLNGTTQFLEYAHPTWDSTGTPPVLDFSANFDIFIWFKRIVGESSDSEHCLFSKWDNGGAGNGIEIFYKVGNFATHDDRVLVRVRNGGVTSSDIISPNPSSSPVHGSLTAWTLIRVKRNEGVISISLGGTNTKVPFAERVTSSYSNDLNNTQVLRFGKGVPATAYPKCRIGQIRVYDNVLSTETDALRIYSERPQFFTCKIAGKVWKIEGDLHKKTLYIKGSGSVFLDTQVDSRDTASGGIWANPQASFELTTRTKNMFIDQSTQNIIHDVVRSADTDYRIISADVTGTRSYSKFIADGNLGQLIQILNVIESESLSYFTYPHKVMIIEPDTEITVDQTFVHGEGGITIETDQKDSTKLVNDLTVIGEDLTIRQREIFNTLATTTFNLTYAPIGTVSVIKSTGDILNQVDYDPSTSVGAFDYKINVDEHKLIVGTALTAGQTLDVSYDHQPANFLVRTSDSASKTQYGIFAKKVIIPQIRTVVTSASKYGLTQWCTSFVAKNKDVNQSYTIKVPTLVNSIRENNGIFIANPLKRYNFTKFTLEDEKGDTLAGTDSEIPVKAIEWRYPEAVTIIKAGEWEYDFYEILKNANDNLDGLNASSNKDKVV